MKTLMYKGIIGLVKDKKVQGKFSGHLLVDGAFVFYGDTVEEMTEDYKDAVEAYLEACDIKEVEPELVKVLDEKKV